MNSNPDKTANTNTSAQQEEVQSNLSLTNSLPIASSQYTAQSQDNASDMSLQTFDPENVRFSNNQSSIHYNTNNKSSYMPVLNLNKQTATVNVSKNATYYNNMNNTNNTTPKKVLNNPKYGKSTSSIRTGSQSPIASLLGSGSRLLEKSLSVINPEPGSLRASTFTVITSIVGGGTLTIPYGIKMSGTLAGGIYLILSGLAALYSTWALIFCAERNNCRSYRKLAKTLYGKKLAYFMQLMLLTLLWCVCVSYMTLNKTLLTQAIQIILNGKHTWEDNKFFLVSAATIIIVVPLALMRKVSALRYASMAGLIIVTFTCGLVTVLFFIWCDGPKCPYAGGEHVCDPDRSCLLHSIENLDLINYNVLDHTYTIAVMISGFADHPTVLPIYFEMQRRSPKRMQRCLIIGFIFVLFLYFDIGYFGYFTFPNSIQQNLLSSDYRHNSVMLITAALLCLYVISVVPLFAHAFRKSLAELLIESNILDNTIYTSKLLTNTTNTPENTTPTNKNKKIKKRRDSNEICDEAREILEYPEDHIAFVPSATPKTKKKLSFGKMLHAEGQIQIMNKCNNNQNNDNNSDSGSFSSHESFEVENGNDGINFQQLKDENEQQQQQQPLDPFQLPTKAHAIVTLTFVGTALVVAMFANNIGTVNSLIGSTTMPLCCFVFPALCAWRTSSAPPRMRYITLALAILVELSSLFQLIRQIMTWTGAKF